MWILPYLGYCPTSTTSYYVIRPVTVTPTNLLFTWWTTNLITLFDSLSPHSSRFFLIFLLWASYLQLLILRASLQKWGSLTMGLKHLQSLLYQAMLIKFIFVLFLNIIYEYVSFISNMCLFVNNCICVYIYIIHIHVCAYEYV